MGVVRKIIEVAVGEGKEEQKFIFKEMMVEDILNTFQNTKEKERDINMGNFLEKLGEFLPLCSDIKDVDILKKLSPSQLKYLFDKFKEVNEVFFDVAQGMGMGEILNRIRAAIIEDLVTQFASSLSQDI